MSTASVLDDIDYDSSFEMVEEEKFEKIENTDNSENFQYVSTKGNTVKEVNINSNEKKKKEAPIQILTAMIGKWKLASSENLQEYFTLEKFPEITQMAWEHGITCYKMNGNQLHVHTDLLGKSLIPTIFEFDKPIARDDNAVSTHAEGNMMSTICKRIADGSIVWKVERLIKNGNLVVFNSRGNFRCKRVYKRVN